MRYTWGSCLMDDLRSEADKINCVGVTKKSQSGSSQRRRLPKRTDDVSFSKKVTMSNQKVVYDLCLSTVIDFYFSNLIFFVLLLAGPP